MARLSKNFTLDEAIRSTTASEKGIDNTPDTQQLINIVHAANGMQSIRNFIQERIFVSSWFRSTELNSAVGGTQNSSHKRGVAVDWSPEHMPVEEAFDLVRRTAIQYRKIILEFPSSPNPWIHIEFYEHGEQGSKRDYIASKNDKRETIYTLLT